MFSIILSILIGKFGLGLVVSAGLLAAWFFIPEVPWITSKVRKLLLMAGLIIGAYTLGYGTGAVEGIANYKAQIAREIAKAVKKGDAAKAKALEEFDASKEIPDDGFARD